MTGGAGYIGMLLTDELLQAGREVTVLDVLLHGQRGHAEALAGRGVRVVEGDVRDPAARRRGARRRRRGRPPRGDRRRPSLRARPGARARRSTSGAALRARRRRRAAGVERLVFASTCSNYGRMADPTVPITEDGALAPVSLYAEQKVAVEQRAAGREPARSRATCLRFATVYGVAPRMRFDLTVNEFTRDLWADGGSRCSASSSGGPTSTSRDAARGVRAVLDAPGRTSPAGCSTSGTRTRTTASSTSSSSSAADGPRRGRRTSRATRTRATTRSASTGSESARVTR